MLLARYLKGEIVKVYIDNGGKRHGLVALKIVVKSGWQLYRINLARRSLLACRQRPSELPYEVDEVGCRNDG
jgi:hypothetical protein